MADKLDEFLLSGVAATTAEIAGQFGVNERTVRKRRKRLRDKGLLQTNPDTPTKLTISGSEEEISFTGLETTNPLDPTDTDGGAFTRIFELAGVNQADFDLVQDSFKFSTWQQSKASDSGDRDLVQLYSYRGTFRKKNLNALTLDEVIKPLSASPLVRQSKTRDNTSFVISLSDLQVGKTGSGGNSSDLAKRLASVFSQIENHLKARQSAYSEIVLVDAGDITEGFHNTAQQAQMNDLSLTDQLHFAQRVVTEAVKRFVPFSERFTYVAVPSNHCRVRTAIGNKNAANAPDDDYGILIHKNTELALGDLPGFDHVRFVRPSKWEEAVTVATTDGTYLGCVHGHQFASAKAGDWLAGMALGYRSGLEDCDVLLHGHWHSFSLSLTGHGQHVVCSPSLDNGSDWFSNVKGTSSPSSLLTFETHDGRSQNWTIWYP